MQRGWGKQEMESIGSEETTHNALLIMLLKEDHYIYYYDQPTVKIEWKQKQLLGIGSTHEKRMIGCSSCRQQIKILPWTGRGIPDRGRGNPGDDDCSGEGKDLALASCWPDCSERRRTVLIWRSAWAAVTHSREGGTARLPRSVFVPEGWRGWQPSVYGRVQVGRLH